MVNTFNIEFGGELKPEKAEVTPVSFDNGIEIGRLSLSFGNAIQPKPFFVKFQAKNRDTYSVWSPLHCINRFLYPTWRTALKIESRAQSGMPLLQFIDKSGNNICLFALSDFISFVKMSGGIDERSGNIEVKAEFFTENTVPCENYETQFYCDTRKVPYYEAIASFNEYKHSLGYESACVPEQARRCLYSSWYSFQRAVTAEGVFEQCRAAKEYGMNNVIIDDGWQTPSNSAYENVYITAGDWELCEPKFGNMKKLIEDLHGIGTKVMLWVGTPFIGSESKWYKFFNGRFLRKNRDDGTVLIADPRYADIREWYVNLLSDRMKEWKLDGFKLDFIDNFTADEKANTDYENMDVPDVNEAVTRLCDEISAGLKKINPEVMIEYRQNYIGPAMQKSGNMFRVDDCAYGALYNRVNGIDLRLLAENTAIHSDMLMWDYEASPEAAADQLTALLFMVPQISMDLKRLSAEHKRVLKFYLDFIDKNLDVLQKGRLVPLYPESNYPVVYAEKGGKVIAALYCAESICLPENTEEFTVVNATGNNAVYIDCGENSLIGREYTVLNCLGDKVASGKINAKTDRYNVPWNGMIICK